ncbi:hypothetical protein [Vibrio sp. 1CM23M]|uniref:hypothetical protein n=1 Tax=Vibrio sp. 1CM23M TaxID=2929164 RepID=UPI0020BD6341|nr:hypothetical protein [Vibrio sp. 1CM23M]MCK8072423.1 hypothetical protein [Vibrio sp. 1CM23M]
MELIKSAIKITTGILFLHYFIEFSKTLPLDTPGIVLFDIAFMLIFLTLGAYVFIEVLNLAFNAFCLMFHLFQLTIEKAFFCHYTKESALFSDAKDEIEESVLDYYKGKIKNLDSVDTDEMGEIVDEAKELIAKYRKHGLKHFESKNRDKITGVLGNGDPKSTSLVVKEFYRLSCLKVKEVEEQYNEGVLEAKHAIDKVCIKARFWDNLCDLEHNFLLFKSSLDEFDTDLNSNDLSASEKLEISAQKAQFLNECIEAFEDSEMFEDTEKLAEMALYEAANNNHQSEKIAVMETA